MTALVVARSQAGLELITAARTLAGSTGPAVLVSYLDAAIPELVSDQTRASPADGAFDAVVDLNAELAPHHPLRWQPADTELPLLRRLLRSAWTGGEVDELWVENLDQEPALALSRVFDTAVIQLASPGLLAYGPPGARRPQQVQRRLAHTWYRPLVPGLLPIDRSEATAVPFPAMPATDGAGPVLVLGADLGGAGLLSADAEVDFHAGLLAGAGSAPIAFSPHPAMAPAQRWRVERAAAAVGIRPMMVSGRPAALVSALEPRLVVGCASAVLLRLYAAGHRVRSIGAAGLLAGMSPYHHRDRMPLTIADAVLRPDGEYGRTDRLQALVDSVAFAMRPQALPELRDTAAEFLGGLDESEWRRYFRRHRVERLGLPVPADQRPAPRWSTSGRAGRPH